MDVLLIHNADALSVVKPAAYMGKFFLLIISLALAVSLPAQQPTLPQLQEQILVEKDNAKKAGLLVLRARMRLAADPQQSFADLQDALAIYKELVNTKGEMETYLVLSNYYNQRGDAFTARSFDLLALPIATRLNDERALFQAYSNLSMHYGRRDIPDSAFLYINKALQYRSAMPSLPAIATLYSRLANIYSRKGDFRKGILLTDTAINMIRQGNGPQPLLGSFIMNKASFLEQLGKYDDAAPLYYESIRIKEKAGQPRDLLSSYGNLSFFYRKINNLPESERYARLQLSIARQLNDPRFEGMAMASIGDLHVQKKQGDSAFHYFNQALAILKQANLDAPQSVVYTSLSKYYYETGKYEEALKNLEQSEKLRPPGPAGQPASAGDLLLKGKILRKLGKPKEAEVLLLRSLDLQKPTGVATRQQTYEALYEHYKNNGNYEEALKYQTAFVNTKDSLFNTDVERQIVKARADYEIEKRDNLLALEKKDRELRTVELAKQNQLFWLLAAFVLVLAMALALYIRSYYLKKKAAFALSEKNDRIETLIRELHHRVKNNLQVVSSLLSLQSNRLENEMARQAMEEGRTRVDAMAMIHQKLYMDEDLASVDMEDYLVKLSQSLAGSFGYGLHNIETIVRLDKKTMDIDMAVPIGLIVNELITNAFKHAFSPEDQPKISVTLQMSGNNTLNLQVADNGKGLEQGTVQENNKSFGMKLVHTLVKQLDATMEVKQLNGTIFDISIRA